MPGNFEASFGGLARGFHVYQAVWSPAGHGSSVATTITNAQGATCIYSYLSTAFINLVLQLALFLE